MEPSPLNHRRTIARLAAGMAIATLLCLRPVRVASNGAFSAAPSILRHTYTTMFPKTENPISEGGKWTNGAKDALDWTDVRTAAGLAFGTEPGGKRAAPQEYDDSTALLTGTWAPNQSAQATVHSVNPNNKINEEVELRLRSTLAPHKATGYEILFRSFQGDDSYCEIVRWNGSLGDFTYVARAKGPPCGIADGSVVKATAIGSVITAYINGVQVVQGRDSTYPNGNPGIGFFLYGATDLTADFGFRSFTAWDE